MHKRASFIKLMAIFRQKSIFLNIFNRVLLWVLHAVSVQNKPWPSTLVIHMLLCSAIFVFRTVATSFCQFKWGFTFKIIVLINNSNNVNCEKCNKCAKNWQ